MELNTKGKRKTVVNPEGSIVYSRDSKVQLYLEASNLRIKSDAFYTKAEDNLDSLIKLAQAEKDQKYLEGLAKFLADGGIKLSPIVLSAVLSNQHYSFRAKRFERIFNTPQAIANAVALGKRLHLNNSFKQNCLKTALEGMSAFTLKKNKMESRGVKTKDLIKLLRPKPKDAYMGKLYKDIIEGGKLSRLKAEDTLISMKSDKNMTDSDKIEYYEKNIEKIPINMLVRNLKYISENIDYKTQVSLWNKIINRLNSIEDFRYLNVFDLIEASIAVPQMEKPLHEITKAFVERVRKKNNFDFGDVTMLFDISGSMAGEGEKAGFKYAVLLSLLYNNVDFYRFGDSLLVQKSTAIKDIKTGNIQKAYAEFANMSACTALVQSILELIELKPGIQTLIVISDEVSWKEGNDLRHLVGKMTSKLAGKKLILINPKVYQGTVFEQNVIGIASLTSSIMLDLQLHQNPIAFIDYIRNYDFRQ